MPLWTCVCWGLNSHCFPMVGMVINLIVGVYKLCILYTHYTDSRHWRWDDHPQYKELIDPGTCGCSSNHEGPQWLMIWHKTMTWSLICSSQNGPRIVWGPQAVRIRIFNQNNDVKQNSWFGRVFLQLLWVWSKAWIVDLSRKKGGENPHESDGGNLVRFSRDTRSPTFSWSKVPNSQQKREQAKGLGHL